jgi:hypothetical protein
MKFLFLTIVILTYNICYSQSVKTLEDNNGFRQYKLGSIYSSSYGTKEKYITGVQRVTLENAIEYISDIPVNVIELFFINDSLAQIILRFKTEYGYQLKDACESAFGKATKNDSNTETTRMFDKTQKKISLNDYYSLKWLTNKFTFSYYYSLPITFGDNLLSSCHLVYTINDYDKRVQRAKKKVSPNDF